MRERNEMAPAAAIVTIEVVSAPAATDEAGAECDAGELGAHASPFARTSHALDH
jgi:hypothetical protein